eukprot:3252927-Karenia_brevis.AAC.1
MAKLAVGETLLQARRNKKGGGSVGSGAGKLRRAVQSTSGRSLPPKNKDTTSRHDWKEGGECRAMKHVGATPKVSAESSHFVHPRTCRLSESFSQLGIKAVSFE